MGLLHRDGGGGGSVLELVVLRARKPITRYSRRTLSRYAAYHLPAHWLFRSITAEIPTGKQYDRQSGKTRVAVRPEGNARQRKNARPVPGNHPSIYVYTVY